MEMDVARKNPPLAQISSCSRTGLILLSILEDGLYNGVAASISTSEHGTPPSSREATACPSSG
jgi:hypothetical protein